MADDRPNAEELIETVREFLHDTVLPTMSGHGAFEVRIAANLLAIALRDLQQGPAAAAAERTRLTELLGVHATDDDSTAPSTLEALDAELARRIRAGEIGVDDPALRAHLRETVRARLAACNPKYLER